MLRSFARRTKSQRFFLFFFQAEDGIRYYKVTGVQTCALSDLFAGNAFLQCPLTIDDTVFRQSLDALDVNTIPEGGTAIGAAIETASGAFKEETSHKVIVLLDRKSVV